jgi:hypothetical protein
MSLKLGTPKPTQRANALTGFAVVDLAFREANPSRKPRHFQSLEPRRYSTGMNIGRADGKKKSPAIKRGPSSGRELAASMGPVSFFSFIQDIPRFQPFPTK